MLIDAGEGDIPEIIKDDTRERFIQSFYKELRSVPNHRHNLRNITIPVEGVPEFTLEQHEVADIGILGAWAAIGELEKRTSFPDGPKPVLMKLLRRAFEELNITGDRDGNNDALDAIGMHLRMADSLDHDGFSEVGLATLLRAGFRTLYQMGKNQSVK